jgi:hypothetical protein
MGVWARKYASARAVSASLVNNMALLT